MGSEIGSVLAACRTWKAQDADDANADERLCCGGQAPR